MENDPINQPAETTTVSAMAASAPSQFTLYSCRVEARSQFHSSRTEFNLIINSFSVPHSGESLSK